ncbi:MAG: hypothetical protein U0324_24010 [Polyangiales bacterium]
MIPTTRHHQLTAAALAFPLCDNAALRLASTSLSRSAVGVASDPLAAAALEHLRTLCPGASLAQLTHLRDAAWFTDAARDAVPLTERVVALATEHLEHRGRRVGLRQNDDLPLAERVERWRWLSLALPADLLLAAFAASCGASPRADHVELVSAHLARTLSSPCAETHLHVGAAVPFGVLWTGLLRHLAQVADPRTLLGPKTLAGERFGPAVPLSDPPRYLHLLYAVAVARLVLASYLMARERGTPPPFREFLPARLRDVAGRIAWPWGALDAERRLRATIGLLSDPKRALPHNFFIARDLLRAMSGRPAPEREDPFEDLVARDELTSWLGVDGDVLPETRFCARALAFLRGDGRGDDAFARLFWQYQRVRCASFRLLTQPPGTAGLDWFTCFYQRISFFRDALPKRRGQEPSWFHALLTQARDLHLGALEARTAPDERVPEVRDFVRDIARQRLAFHPRTEGRASPEVGLVLHFVKKADDKITGRGLVSHADPTDGYYNARHGRWYADQSRRADAVAGTLRNHPELLLVLRGVDVANHELAQPTWVLLPLFDRARRASEDAAHRLAITLPRWNFAPLRATAHAGEDYLRLVEGLRRMHEAVEFHLLCQGDRFGHGLAVGADPEGERDTTVHQPREDRLDDLLWELDRVARGDFEVPSSRVEVARREALTHARHLYGDAATDTELLIEARRLRHSPAALRRLRYPFVDGSLAPADRAWNLLVHHLTDPSVFRRGRSSVPVSSTAPERAMLQAAQRWLCAELTRREITIEANPSSNLLIGDLHAVTDHPAMRIQPVGHGTSACSSVPLSMNTDNPITFASCLADEFAFVHAALLQRGVSANDALAWLDARRADGWRSRFTLEGSADPERLALLLPELRQRRARSSRSRAAVVSGR